MNHPHREPGCKIDALPEEELFTVEIAKAKRKEEKERKKKLLKIAKAKEIDKKNQDYSIEAMELWHTKIEKHIKRESEQGDILTWFFDAENPYLAKQIVVYGKKLGWLVSKDKKNTIEIYWGPWWLYPKYALPIGMLGILLFVCGLYPIVSWIMLP